MTAKRLGDIINLKRGYDLPEHKRQPGAYPVVSSAGISGFHSEYKIEGEGLVTGRYGTLGEVYYVNGRYWPHNTALYVTDFKGNLPKYVFYLMKCLGAMQTGEKSAVPGVNRNDLHEKIVPYIGPSSQQLIAAVLSTLDAKIELNNRINAELEAMAKTLYDYWFVQFEFPSLGFDTPSGHSAQARSSQGEMKPGLSDFAEGKIVSKAGRPYKSSGGKMVYNAELKREIPAGWEVGTAADLFTFNPTLSLRKDHVASYIDMNALPTKGFMTDLPEKKAFGGGVKFQNGDVVVARITPCLENGKTALITLLNDGEIGFGSTEFIVLRGLKQELSSFAACLSRSDSFRKFAITNMLGTSGRKRLEAKTLAAFNLPIPPANLLSAFESHVSPFFEVCTKDAKENHSLASLRDWLLPMLMNGQVAVG